MHAWGVHKLACQTPPHAIHPTHGDAAANHAHRRLVQRAPHGRRSAGVQSKGHVAIIEEQLTRSRRQDLDELPRLLIFVELLDPILDIVVRGVDRQLWQRAGSVRAETGDADSSRNACACLLAGQDTPKLVQELADDLHICMLNQSQAVTTATHGGDHRATQAVTTATQAVTTATQAKTHKR